MEVSTGDATAMKLNIGCGRRIYDSYVNIDAVRHSEAPRDPDIICEATSIPLENGCAEEVMAIHIFEHFYPWQAGDALSEWKRLLRSGGRLVLELPDVVKCAQNVIDLTMKGGKELDQLGMWGLYGDPRTKDPYMMHRWGWSPTTLKNFLEEHGFIKIAFKPTLFHPAGRNHRDMRVEAVKP